MPHLGQQGPPASKYTPKEDFTKKKQQAQTIAMEARFDSLKDRNRIKREQVGPLSYNVKDFKAIDRPFDKQNFTGKFKRDTSERLTSCSLYKPSRDLTPAPTDTDNAYLLQHRLNVEDLLTRMSTQEISFTNSFFTKQQQIRLRNLPKLKSRTLKHG